MAMRLYMSTKHDLKLMVVLKYNIISVEILLSLAVDLQPGCSGFAFFLGGVVTAGARNEVSDRYPRQRYSHHSGA